MARTKPDSSQSSGRTIGVNFILNSAGTIVPLALSLVIVPLYIGRIGADRYGVMSLVWVLLGYFGFLDFGLSRASANALSRIPNAGPEVRVPVLVTALYLNLALGSVGGVVMYIAASFWANHMASLPPSLHAEILSAVPWMAFMLPLSMVAGVGTGAIESRERFLLSNLLTTFGGVLGQVLPITCAILFGPNLAIIVPAAFASRAISTGVMFAYVAWLERPVDPRRFDRTQVKTLLGYGAWVSVTGMISPMLDTLDQMLVGSLLGPAALAHYTVPMSMTTRSQFVALALAKTLFPRLSRMDREEARALTMKATVTLAYGFAAVCGPAIIVAGPFLTLWLGADFAARSTPVADILLVGAWTNGIAFIPYTFLQGQGRPDLPAKLHTIEIIPFLLVVWGLTVWLGLPGAALAWTLRVSIDLILLLGAGRLLTSSIATIAAPVAWMIVAFLTAELLHPSLVPALAIACVIGLAVLASALLWDEAARQAGAKLVRRIRSRSAPALDIRAADDI